MHIQCLLNYLSVETNISWLDQEAYILYRSKFDRVTYIPPSWALLPCLFLVSSLWRSISMVIVYIRSKPRTLHNILHHNGTCTAPQIFYWLYTHDKHMPFINFHLCYLFLSPEVRAFSATRASAAMIVTMWYERALVFNEYFHFPSVGKQYQMKMCWYVSINTFSATKIMFLTLFCRCVDITHDLTWEWLGCHIMNKRRLLQWFW